MFKKLLIVGVVAACAVGAFKGTQTVAHLRHGVTEAREWADDQIPMEKKFKLLEDEARSLDKDLDRVKTDLAREIVDVRELADATAALRTQVAADQKALMAAGAAIKESTAKVKYGRAELSVEAATARFEKDVALFEKAKARLALQEDTLATRDGIRDTLQKTVGAMAAKKGEMLAQIDAARADYKVLQLAQVESKYQTDDTKLARVKESLRKIKHDIEVRKERLKLEPVGQADAPAAGRKSVDELLGAVAGPRAEKAADKGKDVQ